MKNLIILSMVFVVFGGLAINYFSLIEAYGNGSPYYSRSTNMDKWTSPFPLLLFVDTILIGIIWLGYKFIKKRY